MSYKYTNVREYQGGLIFEDRKNQNRVTVNSDAVEIYSRGSFLDLKKGVKIYDNDTTKNVTININGISYKQDHNTPDRPYFSLDFDGYDSALNFYTKTDEFQSFSRMNNGMLKFTYLAPNENFATEVSGIFGVKVLDEIKRKNNQMTADGLYITDGNNTCYLKFEDGKLKINGKEIATIENP